MTKYQLISALFENKTIVIKDILFLSLISIEREDGSGKSFNVTGYDKHGVKTTVHVYTID